eukprot:scaffold12190_cov120-Isochrysis_galbana.AAC.8
MWSSVLQLRCIRCEAPGPAVPCAHQPASPRFSSTSPCTLARAGSKHTSSSTMLCSTAARSDPRRVRKSARLGAVQAAARMTRCVHSA